MSRVRPVLPRLPYVPPPPPDRLDPRSITPAAAARLLETLPPDAELARALVSSYRGISPVMAHEIVFRATGSSETRAGDRERGERGAAGTRDIGVTGAVADNGLESAGLSRAWSRRSRRGRCVLADPHDPPRRGVRRQPGREHVGGAGAGGERRRSPQSGAPRSAPAASARLGGRGAGEGGAAAGGAGERVGAGGRGGAAQDRRRVDLRLSLADRARSGLAGRRRHIDPARSRSDRERERPGLLRALPQGAERGGATARLGGGESRGDRLSRSVGDIDRAGAGIFRVGGSCRGVGGASGAGSCVTAKEDDRPAPAAGARRRPWEQRLRRPQRPPERARHLRHRRAGRHLAACARRRRLARGDPLAIP